MALYVAEGDEIWDWAAGAYAGRELGFPVYWDNNLPTSGYAASHVIPRQGQVALLRIRPLEGSSPLFFERAWCSFVYEIQNLKNASAFLAVYEEAVSQGVDRDEWIRRNTQLEFLAIERTRAFYEQVWEPWCCARGLVPTPGEWYANAGKTYEEWIAGSVGPLAAEYWGTYFDEVLLDER